jgi:rare lipoprotein A (peptidoglycan hydrolase)
MRPQTPRARRRTALGLGALSTAMVAAGTTAAAAPQQAAAPAAPQAAGAAAPAKAASSLRVTKRRLNVRAGRTARVAGRLTPAAAGRTVTLERRSGRGWKTIDKARTTTGGAFTLTERARRVDTAVVRVRFAGDARTAPAKRRIGRLNVFRPALASWYGPGLYGNKLGCGGTLSAGTVGVAHKSLPCGTRLVLRKGNRLVRAKVIDRGPYVGAREFDLTQATKQRLGFGSTGTVLVAH